MLAKQKVLLPPFSLNSRLILTKKEDFSVFSSLNIRKFLRLNLG